MSNREIATAIWLILISFWLLSNATIRTSLWRVVHSVFHWQILVTITAMFIYTVIMTLLLYAFGFWTISLLKDTIFWFFFSSFAIMMRFITSPSEPLDNNLFAAIIVDNIKVTAVLEFVINTYNFPVIIELFFVPFVTLTVGVQVLSRSKDEYLLVTKMADVILVVIGLVMIYLSLANGIRNYQQFAMFDTIRALLLPPLLSVSFSPLVYATVLVSTYEQVFLRLRLGKDKSPEVIRYARQSIMKHFGIRLHKLQEFLKSNAYELIHVRTKEDIQRIINSSVINHELRTADSVDL